MKTRTLTCTSCSLPWIAPSQRGRVPHLCPSCKSGAPNASVPNETKDEEEFILQEPVFRNFLDVPNFTNEQALIFIYEKNISQEDITNAIKELHALPTEQDSQEFLLQVLADAARQDCPPIGESGKKIIDSLLSWHNAKDEEQFVKDSLELNIINEMPRESNG
jgi:hypothetical protein